MPRIARHFFWDTLETNNIWQGISISGVNPHYLNSAFGFKPTQTPNYGQRFSVGRDLHEPCQNADRLVLRNEFIMAELHTGCAAHLVVLKPTPRAEADQLHAMAGVALARAISGGVLSGHHVEARWKNGGAQDQHLRELPRG